MLDSHLMTKPGRRLSPCFPQSTPGLAGMTTGGSLAELFMSCAVVVAGRAARPCTRSINSTSIKVQRSAAGGEGGASEQAIGRSRGGRATKIHGVADSQRRLFRFTLTAGNIADITAAHELAAKLPSNGCLIADMGYDATKLRV
jgi:hypothetical protein